MKISVVIFCLLNLFAGCRETGTSVAYESPGSNSLDTGARIDSTGKITIVDYSGKSWDITHAVEEYDFDPDRFRHGLGAFAIRPIQNPEFLAEGDPGFPDSYDGTVILGADIENITRAYALRDLIAHEVVDDQFGREYVAVAY